MEWIVFPEKYNTKNISKVFPERFNVVKYTHTLQNIKLCRAQLVKFCNTTKCLYLRIDVLLLNKKGSVKPSHFKQFAILNTYVVNHQYLIFVLNPCRCLILAGNYDAKLQQYDYVL